MPPIHKPQTAWDIDFATESTWADAVDGVPSSQTIGETASFRLVFGSKEYPGRDPPLPKDHQDRFTTVLEHCRHAGQYALNTDTSNGEQLFREQHSGRSVLVRLTPTSEIEIPLGVWGLISGYSSDTSYSGSVCVATLDIDVLAPADEYKSHSEVRTSLAMRGV